MLHSFCRVERTCQEAFRTSPRSTLEAASLESSTTRKCNKIWRDKVPSLHFAHHSAEEQQEKQNVSSRPMIFIYLGGGRSQLWLTLLGLAVTVLLNSGYLSNPSSYAVGPGGVRPVRLSTEPTTELIFLCKIIYF